jgi:hypothetical protein
MQVRDSVPLGNGHSIEFGASTWNPASESVRNRYDNPDGRFSPRGSSEIPLGDLEVIMVETAKRDLLDEVTAARIIEALAASITRRALAGTNP